MVHNNGLAPLLFNSYLHLNTSNIRWKLFKTGRITFTYKKVVKIYIAYETFVAIYCENDSALGNCLFGAAKSTKILLILININILDVVLNLMYVEVFLHQMVRRLVKT